MKTCTMCQVPKDELEFSFNDRSHTRRISICKPCASLKRRIIYEKQHISRASKKVKGTLIDRGLRKLVQTMPSGTVLSLLEIANHCQCTQENIRLIEARALKKCQAIVLKLGLRDL